MSRRATNGPTFAWAKMLSSAASKILGAAWPAGIVTPPSTSFAPVS